MTQRHESFMMQDRAPSSSKVMMTSSVVDNESEMETSRPGGRQTMAKLWNHFDTGFDVFLGKASVSLHQLQHQCNRANKERDSLRTGALWFPLQSSEPNGVASHVSLEIDCIFTSDSKVLCLQKARQQRRRQADVNEDNATSVVDPTFAFTQPFQPVQWSLIASINVRHLFFHSDIKRLANFRELVLYGDLEKELDEDEGLQIDENHLTAFQMCQFSAQYLDHCVDTLSQRLEDYSDDYRSLAAIKGQLRQRHKALTAQRTHLQKEHDNLDLLVTTYKRVLEKSGCNENVGLKLSEQLKGSGLPDQDTFTTDALRLPTSPTGSISSRKPPFLETWEKRERERRLEQEVLIAKQMESEKQRVLEWQQRENYDAIMAITFENRKQHAAKRIQAFFRNIRTMHHAQRNAVEYQAATRIQTAWIRYIHVKKTFRRRETRKKESEVLWMAQNEQEMCLWMAKKRQTEASTHAVPLLDSTNATKVAEESLSPTASPSKQVVDALVYAWRKLHRVFVLAHKSKAIDFQTLFDTIDLRKDKVIDRAELRLGAQSFGVRLDRKITRAYKLITLLRTKCGLPSKPLLVTFEHFVTGFELAPHLAESRDLNSFNENREFFTDHDENKENATVNGPLVKTSLDTQENEITDEESLINVILDLRAAMYESAMSYLMSKGKLLTDYKAFRDALVHIFSQFHTDQNERIDVTELITSMTPLDFRRTNDQISQLREFFIESFDSARIGVAKFISFVLAHSSSGGQEQVGILENRIRETILSRVREVQAQMNNVHEAVRFVLKGAYNDRNQQSCSTRDFMRALIRMRLGVTPAQVVHLVDDLDRDGNCHISFDELLVWLRLRSPMPLAVNTAKHLRILLDKLMFAHASLISSESQKTTLSTLFYHINRDSSGKLKQEELRVFLHAQDLVSLVGKDMLKQLCGLSTVPKDPAAAVAQIIMNRLDLDADGVITLREWLTITQHDTSLDSRDPAGVDAMRQILRESEGDDIERIILWFNELPGTIRAAIGRQEDPTQMQIRVAEFKTALRVKLGGAQAVPMQMINSIVNNLDKDGSGWITTSELCAWVYPPRDLEELLRLVIHCWQKKSQQFNDVDLASNLYACFDVDGNGILGVHELRQGFKTFGLTFSVYETRVLFIAFDLDGDGCWTKAEFEAFVNKLFPVQKLVSTSLTNPVQKNIADPSTEYAISRGRDERSSKSAYSNEPLFESGSTSKDGQDDAQLVEYSEDFVED